MFLFSPGPAPCLHWHEEKTVFFPVLGLKVALKNTDGACEFLTVPESAVCGLAMKEIGEFKAGGGFRAVFLLAAAFGRDCLQPYAYAAGLWLRSTQPWHGERVYFSPLRAASRTIDPYDTRVWCTEGTRRVFDASALVALGDIRQTIASCEGHYAGELVCVGTEVHPAFTPGEIFEAGVNGVGLLKLLWR